MVQRYNSSLSVPTAEVAKPRDTGLAQLGDAVRDFAKTAAAEATRKFEEKNLALESAALNEARIQLAKRGGELALELQQGRVAGSNYVPDLEKARAALKDEIWAGLPALVQKSQRATLAWDDIWTSDQIASTRAAVGWQQGEEKSFAVNSLNNGMLALSATIEADPTSALRHLDQWNKSVPTYAGLVDNATLEDAKTKAAQAFTQSAVRGFAKQGKFDEATKLIADMSAQLTPDQRKQFEGVIEDAQNDIERERRQQEADLKAAQVLASNEIEVRILDGKGSRQEIDAAVQAGKISVNDQPALIRALREQQERERVQAERAAAMTPEQKKAWEAASADDKYFFASLSQTQTPQFLADPATWPQSLRDRFAGMTAADQEWVMNKRLTMKVEGGSADAVTKLAGDLMAEAKRWAPPEWMLGGTSKDALESAQNVAITSQIQRLAEQLAPQLGGTPIQQKQAQEEIVRLFKAYDPAMNLSGVPAFQRARLNSAGQISADMTGIDWGLWNRASQMLGPDATTAQIAAAYTQAGGLNADKVR